MRIGTWNVNLSSTTSSASATDKTSWIGTQAVDVWLFTEVHHAWSPRGRALVVSPPRGFGPSEQRWAGIDSAIPFGGLRTVGALDHAGEEGLVLARLELTTAQSSTVLVACSVLPWKSPGKFWLGLPSHGQAAQFRHVLDHHVARIDLERQREEPLIWGGDFNQQLTRPFESATAEGEQALRNAFDHFGLVPLTERAEHLDPTMYAIDHLAVSAELVAGEPVAAVHRTRWDERQLSNHAAYTADVRL